MKKKSIAKIFFMSLLKSLLCIVLIVGVGFISYKISYAILSKEQNDVGTSKEEISEIKNKATVDEVSKNLIYVTDSDNKLKGIMLEICNTKTNNMDYVTIPTKADYTIPSVMYRKLCQVNEGIPQVIRLSSLKQYFSDEDDAYGYGVLIFEKMLGVDISYYTAIDQETFENHYEKKKVKIAFKAKSDINNTPDPDGVTPVSNTTLKTKMKICTFSEAYKKQLTDLNGNEETIANFIKDQYERISSNLTQYNKIGYIGTYEKVNVDNIHYWGIPCTYSDKLYMINTKAAKKALKALEQNDESYTEAQDLSALNKIGTTVKKSDSSSKSDSDDKDSDEKSSKDLTIRVLNGSQIAGLASSYKSKLESKGYNVPKVGNYTSETLTRTRIIVSKKGQGEDLVKYFDDPEISVGGVAEGFDIEIVLGTADAN